MSAREAILFEQNQKLEHENALLRKREQTLLQKEEALSHSLVQLTQMNEESLMTLNRMNDLIANAYDSN